VAGVGVEVSALLVFAAWAIGGAAAVAVLTLAVVPVAAVGLRQGTTADVAARQGHKGPMSFPAEARSARISRHGPPR
jgi:hypothetical protein